MALSKSISLRAAIAALAFSCTPAGAQEQPKPFLSGALALDVAGVRLGMSPEAAKAALSRAGYRIESASDTSSFAQIVGLQASQRRGRQPVFGKDMGTDEVVAIGPHQERAEVHFLQRPAGSSVAGVIVDIPTTAMTSDAFWRQTFAKYPKPETVRSQGTEAYWCSVEVGTNCGLSFVASGPMSTDYPLLTASSGSVGGGRLRLQVGQRAYDAQHAEVEAAVVRLVPKTSSAAF